MNDFIVAGLGPSLKKLPSSYFAARRVVAVNDFPYRCEHLVVLDGPNDMAEEKRDRIFATLASTVWFARLEWWEELGFAGGKQLGSMLTGPEHEQHFRKGLDLCRVEGETGWLPKGPGTPTVAASLAFALGADRIGLIGLDLSGEHPMANERLEVESWFRLFARLVKKHDCELRAIGTDALRWMQVSPDWIRECTSQA